LGKVNPVESFQFQRYGVNEERYLERESSLFVGWLVGWLGFNGILSTQVAAISCLRKFKVC